MEVTANAVIEHLLHQISQQSKDIAVLKAQIDILMKENEELKQANNEKSGK